MTGDIFDSDYTKPINHDNFDFCGNLIKTDDVGPIMVPQIAKMMRKLMMVSD